MPNYSVAQVSPSMDPSLGKLIEQATLASKLFEGCDVEQLYGQGIVLTMQGCSASALGVLFVLKGEKRQDAVNRLLANVNPFDRNVFKKALAAT